MADPQMVAAIRSEAQKRTIGMLKGLESYQLAPDYAAPSPYRVIWEKGAARLLDFAPNAPADAPLLFILPSLINKYTILDLYPERSLVRYLCAEGIRPLVLDWGAPTRRESSYNCADYVYYVAEEAWRAVCHLPQKKRFILGYCMGGILALALALRTSLVADGLALLATPWKFLPPEHNEAEDWHALDERLSSQPTIPPLWTQTLFHLMDPWHFQKKFSRFEEMSGAEQRHFIAVEQWVNDGVPLASPVAKECFVEWPYKNRLLAGEWQVAGQSIHPRVLACPAFIAVPMRDRIVPPVSSEPLAQAIKQATIIRPQAGHVSMVVGEQAQADLWQPLTEWLYSPIGKKRRKS